MFDNFFIYVLFSGIIQGLTEFLPISSSGHLAILNIFFPKIDNNLDFEIILHFGTVFSIIIYYKKDLLNILKQFFSREDNSIVYLIILGCIPISLVGLLAKDTIEKYSSDLSILPYTFMFTSFLLFMTRYNYKSKKITFNIVLVMALFQILALLPGVSRSGITISILLILGINMKEAVKFSFLMAIPLILGATFLSIDFTNYSNLSLNHMLLGSFISFLFGWVAIYLTNYFLLNSKYWIFSIYCFLISIITYFII
ncbi:MAG: UDP-diphosphatase [Candidatus Marinimicrobia bacterium]|nr:UDP-diphosphatase [Candidatus Neomarinimicrobiota bacterium]|tara:strand:- start:2060 stop:2824 length:765 start_codon:yes stop_codon:yes gene_type:complete